METLKKKEEENNKRIKAMISELEKLGGEEKVNA
jgi:hypothetical protein